MSGDSRLIVLTGATRGLGRMLVDRFAELGHVVAGCGRSAQAVAALRDAFGAPHDFRQVDVTSAGDVARWAKRLVAEKGAPDLLINNAALINRNAALWEVSAEEFGQVIDVNVKGVHNVLRAFVPAMIERGSGVIVNVSSGWGRSTSPDVVPYCTSKWAIEGLTQGLAQELPAGLAVVSLNPGVIDTDMLRSVWGEGAGSQQSPEDWSHRAAPYLLSLGPEDNGAQARLPPRPGQI